MFTKSTNLVFLTAFLLMFAFAPFVNAQEFTIQVVQTLTSAHMKSMFQDQGFTNVEVDSDDDLIVRMQGYKVMVFVRGNNYSNIQYRFAIGGVSATMDDINDWNREKKFSKAYLDNDGDPVLEMDVDLEGGVTIARIKNSMRTFNISLAAFLREVAK